MLTLLATGTLLRDPESRTSKAGKPYATGLLRVPCEGEEAVLCSLIAFSDSAATALVAHEKGDEIAVAGRAKPSAWTGKDGEEKRGLSVVVERVLSTYMLEKRRAKARGEPEGDAKPELERVARAQERRAGELLKAMQKATPQTAKRSAAAVAGDSDYRGTIERAKIPERTAQRWQELAEVPKERFEAHLAAEEKPSARALTGGLAEMADDVPF